MFNNNFLFRQKYNLDYICNKREPEKFLSQWKHLIENDEKHETLLGIELLTLESCFLIVLGTLTNQGKWILHTW